MMSPRVEELMSLPQAMEMKPLLKQEGRGGLGMWGCCCSAPSPPCAVPLGSPPWLLVPIPELHEVSAVTPHHSLEGVPRLTGLLPSPCTAGVRRGGVRREAGPRQ